MTSQSDGRVIVAQLGARLHYGAARGLHSAGLLYRLYTDICGAGQLGKVFRSVPPRFRPRDVQRLLDRIPHDIPVKLIQPFNAFGLEYAIRRRRAKSLEEVSAVHLWAGRRFARLVVNDGLDDVAATYTFNSAGLEIELAARSNGAKRIVEQTIVPRTIEYELLSEETQRFPEWQPPLLFGPSQAALSARETEEWAAADVVVCGSDFVRDSLALCGVRRDRCIVIPYGIDVADAVTGDLSGRPVRTRGALNVLCVGAVSLRKGIGDLARAAALLRGLAHFRVVGAIGITNFGLKCLTEPVAVYGPVLRSQVAEHYRWADVFLLPSLVEGSATATYEALAFGLPVICTRNAGSIVRDGIEGYIVPIRDADTIADRITRLYDDRELLRVLSQNARARSRDYTLRRYSERLREAMGSVLVQSSAAH